jgi:hypothetical protein
VDTICQPPVVQVACLFGQLSAILQMISPIYFGELLSEKLIKMFVRVIRPLATLSRKQSPFL